MPGIQSRTIPLLVLPLILLFVLAAPASPAEAQQTRFAAGKWTGAFYFSLEHSYDKPSADLGLTVNSYSLETETARGTMKFTVSQDGEISGVMVSFPKITYWAILEQVVTWDVPCKGYSASASGYAQVSKSQGSSVMQRLTGEGIFTMPMSITSNVPAVNLITVGSGCGLQEYITGIRDALAADIARMGAAPWVFKADRFSDDKISGTCTTEPWVSTDHNMLCLWQAWRRK